MAYKKSTFATAVLASLSLLPGCMKASKQSNLEITQDMVEASFKVSLKKDTAKKLTSADKKDFLALLQKDADLCILLTKTDDDTAITKSIPATRANLNTHQLKRCLQNATSGTSIGHGFQDTIHENDYAQNLAETAVMAQIDKSKRLTDREKVRVKSSLAYENDGRRLFEQEFSLCNMFLDSQCPRKRKAFSKRTDQEARKRFNIPNTPIKPLKRLWIL